MIITADNYDHPPHASDVFDVRHALSPNSDGSVTEIVSRTAVEHNPWRDAYGTPPEIIALEREVMGGIDLDPASNPTRSGRTQTRARLRLNKLLVSRSFCVGVSSVHDARCFSRTSRSRSSRPPTGLSSTAHPPVCVT